MRSFLHDRFSKVINTARWHIYKLDVAHIGSGQFVQVNLEEVVIGDTIFLFNADTRVIGFSDDHLQHFLVTGMEFNPKINLLDLVIEDSMINNIAGDAIVITTKEAFVVAGNEYVN